jgi:hypothetical protein
MSNFDLIFQGKSFTVPKKSVLELLVQHRDLLDAPSYSVQSSVPGDIFALFVDSLSKQTKLTVTQANYGPLSLLAKEFALSDLRSECTTFSVDSVPDLSARISRLEAQLSSLETRLTTDLQSVKSEIETLKTAPGPRPSLPESGPLSSSSPPSASPASIVHSEYPLKEAKSFDGIIAYLTQKHGGNVHEKGIVTITAKSLEGKYTVNPVADLASPGRLMTKNEPGQWVCWDFGKSRVTVKNYTVNACFLQSWAIEISNDGASWREVDRQNGQPFKSFAPASFDIANPAEGRFVRLAQTGQASNKRDKLFLQAVEFFGTLVE